MVCHGEPGTVVGALAAGLPMVVIPLSADQPDNARCNAAAGLGVAVSREGLASLAGTVTDALGQTEMRACVDMAPAAVGAMPTVQEAIDRLCDRAIGAPNVRIAK
jgi:UDP:flavonoid glycosyltransferase YjiC (YdhE family)